MAIRPIFRWAGSKRKILAELVAATPQHFDRYFEPFAGSACLFFAVRPRAAVLGDINAQLIEAYDTIRRNPIRVASVLALLPTDADFYYGIRDHDPAELSKVDRAARFLFLNRLSFNGVYRTNRHGKFNVPPGRRTGAMPSVELLRSCADALQRATLCHGDFERTVADVGPDDFVYLDPPYAKRNRAGYGEYGYGSFAGTVDLDRFVSCADALNQRGARVLISYSDQLALKERFPKWHHRRLRVRRHVAGFASDRRTVSEMLLANYTISRMT
jgi:DNA adenine methylase